MTDKPKTEVRGLATASLPMADWVHVVNAVESSFQRKKARGEHKKADEMQLIGISLIRQIQEGRTPDGR